MTSLSLNGCRPDTMDGYLKSLGVISILSKLDDNMKSYWNNGVLVLETGKNKDEICSHILHDYKPMPIMTPWSVNKHKKSIKIVERLLKDNKARFEGYGYMSEKMKTIEDEFRSYTGKDTGIIAKENNQKTKARYKLTLLEICRNHFHDDVVPWFDAAVVISRGNQKNKAVISTDRQFSPLCGTGGNIGNFDLAENYLKCIENMLVEDEQSGELLDAELFGANTPLVKAGMSGHDPTGNNERPNGSTAFTTDAISNPWTIIFLMEGIAMFAGNPVRHRLSTFNSKAAFPFTCDTSVVGYGSASDADLRKKDGKEPAIKGEIWAPLWSRPSSVREIRHMFGDGRVRLFGRDASDGVEFMMAVKSVGTEYAIPCFNRFVILTRNGRDPLYINMGSVYAGNVDISPLREIDELYKNSKKNRNMSQTFTNLVWNHEKVRWSASSTGLAADFSRLLASTGEIGLYLSTSRPKWLRRPIMLSDKWLEWAYDESPEFRLAASVASIGRSINGYHIRENIESVNLHGTVGFVKKSGKQVWHANGTTLSNLERVVIRRCVDGTAHEASNVAIPASLYDIGLFLNGRINMKKLGSLIPPLAMVNMRRDVSYPWNSQTRTALPESYSLVKLSCISDANGRLETRHDPRIMNLLNGKRLREATALAVRKLRTAKADLLRKYSVRAYTGDTTITGVISGNLLASMAFPLDAAGITTIAKGILAQRDD